MATVKFFKNILEDSYQDITVENGRSIESVVREYGEDEVYTSSLVECYDAEADKTIYVPLTNESDYGLVCSVNGVEQTKDYKLQENDVCVVILTPMSGNNENWNWGAAVAGLFIGATLGVLTAGAVWGFTAVTALRWGAGIGAFIGFIAGGIAFADKNKKSEKTGTQLPDVAGSANQPITGNQIPLVLGRMNVSPFIVGSPYVEFTNLGGKDAWIKALYLIGYSPLRLSDIRFDCLPVADGTHNGRELYAGKISGAETDGGDIKTKWNANKIEFEIIQQNDGSQPLYLGENYNVATKQVGIEATPMYIKDSLITDIERESEEVTTLVKYHNKGYDDGFRTNSIRFSEQYVKNLEVAIDIPDAVYKERSNDGDTDRSSIPLWIAIQWRPYNQNTVDEDVLEKNSGNYAYEWKKDSQEDGWITFDHLKISDDANGNPVLYEPELYTEAKKKEDYKAHSGNKIIELIKQEPLSNDAVINALTTIEKYSTPGGTFDIPILYSTWRYGRLEFDSTATTKERWTYQQVSNKKLYVPNERWKNCPIPESTYQTLPRETVKESHYYGRKYVECGNWPYTEADYEVMYGNEDWNDSQAFNLQYVQNYVTNNNSKKDFNLNEIRVTAKADLKKFCEDNGLMPEDFLYGETNTTKAIEVRVIRISPNYIDEVKGDGKKIGPWSFHDTIKWTTLTSFTIKTDNINEMENEIPISEEKYRKACLLSLKCKVDNTGNINGQISKLSVIAQSMQPVWSEAERKWYPENIVSSYKYFDGEGNETNKEVYEGLRQQGNTVAERTKGGNNYLKKIQSEIFGQDYDESLTNPEYASSNSFVYLTPSVMKYLEKEVDGKIVYNNSSSSAFLYATVGGHLGKDALGYNRSHLLSLGEWWEDCQDVYDGRYHVFMACNGYIYSAIKLEDLLAKISVTGRASYTLDDNGKLVAVMDKPVDYPVGMLNNQNALSTSITYDYKPAPSGFMINFKNQDNFNIDEAMPVMQNGEDWKNPRREIESAQIDLVTDKIQLWSLGRYMMANRIFGKNALSWKSGIEGFDLQFGNVIKVSNSMLLIGQGCGRIAEILEDDDYIYGFILTDSYENDGKPGHAIEIMQMSQYGEDRVIVRNVNESDYDGDEVDFRNPKKGLTNKVILSTPEPKNPEDNAILVFTPEIGDNVTYGIADKVTAMYRIKSKTPDSNFTFTFALTPYCEEFYNYGAELPAFNNNMTIPSRVSDREISSDNQATLEDINSRLEQVRFDLEEQIADIEFDATAVYQLALDSPVLTKNAYGEFYNGTIVLTSKKFSNNRSEIYPCYYKVFYTTLGRSGTMIYETPEGGDPVSQYSLDVSDYTNAFSFIVETYYKDKDSGELVQFDNQTISILSDGSSEDKSTTIIMSNENHGFAGDTEKAIGGATTSKVYVYKGTESVPCTVKKIDGKTPTTEYQNSSIAGLQFMVDKTTADNVINIYFRATTDLVEISGEIPVQIEADEMTYDKTFSFTVSRKPEDPYILYITGSNIIRNNTGSVVLSPFVTKGGVDILNIPDGLELNWYKDSTVCQTHASGTVISTCRLTLSANDINEKVDITCKLEDV